jgi:hypothetical protein
MKNLYKIAICAGIICLFISISFKTAAQQLSIVSVAVKNETKIGAHNGSIVVKVKNAKYPIIYGLTKGFKLVKKDSTGSSKYEFKNLTAGKYLVLVSDQQTKDSVIYYPDNPVIIKTGKK